MCFLKRNTDLLFGLFLGQPFLMIIPARCKISTTMRDSTGKVSTKWANTTTMHWYADCHFQFSPSPSILVSAKRDSAGVESTGPLATMAPFYYGKFFSCVLNNRINDIVCFF